MDSQQAVINPQSLPSDTALALQQAEAQFALSPIGQMAKQFEIVQQMGAVYAASTIVPDTYKASVLKYDKATKQWLTTPNPSGPANCAIAIDMAIRMNMPPVMVMQNLYIVSGNPAWSSKFLIGCINSCGRFQPLEYEIRSTKGPKGDDFAVRCVGYAKSDTKKAKPLNGTWITWQMVRAEGWDTKNGSKWLTMPEQMFRYRAAAFWQRTYAPEISLGLMTQEEAEDVRPGIVDVPATEVKTEPAEPAKKPLDPRRKADAEWELKNADTPEAVKAVRDTFYDIYEGDANFRQALIDKMNEAIAHPAQPAPAASQTEPSAPTPDQGIPTE